MNVVKWCAIAAGLVCTGATLAQGRQTQNKLPDTVVKALEKAGSLTVYSLGGETNEKDGWHGAKVLGQTTVEGDKDVKALVTALKKGVTDGDRGARCFNPRHGVRVAYDDKRYDLLICFECGWVYIFTDGSDKPVVLMIADTPQKLLDKILTDARVPLPKPDKK